MYIYHAPINALSPAMVVSSPWVRGEEGRGLVIVSVKVRGRVGEGAEWWCWCICVCLCVNVRVGVYALFLSALCLILGMFNVFALIVNQF